MGSGSSSSSSNNKNNNVDVGVTIDDVTNDHQQQPVYEVGKKGHTSVIRVSYTR